MARAAVSASTMNQAPVSRRRALQTLFCSSAALALNLRPDRAAAEIAKEGLHLLMIGDFGTGGVDQAKVAGAMQKFVGDNGVKPEGLLNAVLLKLGLPTLSLLNTDTAVYIGLVYAYLPFMVLPLYAVLERQDESQLEAAADLGCTPIQAFWRVTFPQSLPGVAAGALLCFIPMVGEFVIPDLLGGSGTLMLGKVIWTEFFANRDWPAASAVAIVMLATLIIPTLLYQRQQARMVDGQ